MREKHALLAAYAVFAIAMGISPNHRADWALENSVPLLEVTLVVWYDWRHGFELTPISLRLIFIHVLMQVYGGHYTYAETPLFNWARDTFEWSRNHYDRLAHFSLGFCLVIPIRDICLRWTPLASSKSWAAFFSLTTITAIAGLWEVWEWIVADLAYADLGATYLGTQGDVWDAQKDIALAPLGALVALAVFSKWHDRSIERLSGAETPLRG